MTRIRGDWLLLSQINNAIVDGEIPAPVQEYQFAPPRRWRFDYCWVGPDKNVALEYEGGTYTNGGHVRGQHYASDCEKYSTAAILGWCVVRATPEMVRNGKAIELLKRALSVNGFISPNGENSGESEKREVEA
jgi:hypothetical protein